MLPDHMTITPDGRDACTNAVVASCVVLVPYAAVGARGVPVKVGDADNTTEPEPVEEVTPVPPLATASVPVMSAVLRLMASQLELVPSVWRYLLALLVWLGSSAFKAALAVVWPVPPLAIATVPVTLVDLIS